MQSNRIYNLAVSSSHLQLPRTAPLNEPSLPHCNMFTDYRRKWHARRDLDSSKGYDIVGLKELKSYQNRLKKASRATIRVDSLSTDRAISKASSDIKKIGPDLLSKEEVINCVPKLQQQVSLASGLKKRTKRKRESWMTFSTDLEHPQGTLEQEIKLQGSQCSQFSVTRLRKRMDEHRKEWEKHQTETGKFPDIYRSIEMHRQKLERRERESGSNEDLVVTRSSLWGETLRTDKGMRDLCLKKDLTRTIHDENSFLTRGHSKMEAEKQWLQRKDEAGFKFKLYPAACPEQLKKTVVFR